MWRLIFLSFVGCGIVQARLQPHTETVASTFDQSSASCAGNAILFTASYDRGAFLGGAGFDLKNTCLARDVVFKLRPLLTGFNPSSGTGCGPAGVMSLEAIQLVYEYSASAGAVERVVFDFDCPESSRNLNMSGDLQLLVDAIGLCFEKIEADGDKRIREALNRKAAKLTFSGKGTCSADFCGAFAFDVSLEMTGATVNQGDAEVCK